jgi:hypothetical protein
VNKVTVKGTIVGTEIACTGKDDLPYGYIDVLTSEDERVHFKVDVNTKHGKLNAGLEVEAELEHLGISEILRATNIKVQETAEA